MTRAYERDLAARQERHDARHDDDPIDDGADDRARDEALAELIAQSDAEIAQAVHIDGAVARILGQAS
ncbi:MAG: hypothetical protein ACO1ON_13065 [Nocardioides sp.]